MTGRRFSGLPTPRGKNLAGPRHACQNRPPVKDGVHHARRFSAESQSMETTRTAPAPSRQTCPISSLVRKPAPSSSTTAAACSPLVIPGVFQLKASKGEDEPRKSKKSFIRTLFSKPKAAVGVDFQPQKRSGSSVVTRTTWTATVRVRPWQAVTGCHRLSRLSQLSQAVTGCHTISRV